MRLRPSKNDYFLSIADQVRNRSPDPKTQVGAVLVDNNDRIVGTGYNGPPQGFSDESLNWADRESVYPFIVHAEMNAILYSGARYDERAKLYVTLSPCKDCIKLIAASGIKTIFFRDRYKDFGIVNELAKKFGITLIEQKEQNHGQEEANV